MMKFSAIRTVSIAVVLLLAACASAPGVFDAGTLIENVTVVNTRDGSLTTNQSIAILDGRIVRIAPTGSISAGATTQVIDARGKYVVPGYLDMHYHALEALDRSPNYWPLMVAHGITGFREMSGSAELLEHGKRFRKDNAAANAVAPELLLQPGRLISTLPDGRRAGITTAEQALAEVREQKQLGADFIKIVAVNRDTFFATMEETRRQGLTLAGHLSPVVSAVEASNAGMRAMEHFGAGLISVALDCSSDEAAIRKEVFARAAKPKPAPPAPPTAAQIQRALVNPLLTQLADADLARRVLDTFDEQKCRQVARTFVKNGTWQVPTLYRLRTMQFSADPVLRADPNNRLIIPKTRALWMEVAEQFSKIVAAPIAETYRRFYTLQLRMVKIFNEEGVRMLAGPDAGQWTVPGLGLHREFDELARAGLSPLEVLRMGTLNAAQFLGREDDLGAVEPGKRADLVLLEDNPLDRVAHLHGIAAVVLKGRYLPKAELDKMINGVAEAHR